MSGKDINTKTSWLAKADKWYIKNPVVRSLIQLLGGVTLGTVSGLDAALVTQIQNMREKRLRAFFEELDKGDIQLTNGNIQSDDFLHAFFATTKATLNTRRHEKIQLFARLLKSLANNKALEEIDEYEDYLCILDELSYRELVVLGILEKYELANPQKQEENSLQRCSRFWEGFIKDVTKTLKIDELEVNAVLTRLNRSGCYQEITGGYFDYTGGKGSLTPLYYKLKKLISEDSEMNGKNIKEKYE